MRKHLKNNKIIALVLSATIIATTGCNSSGNNNTAVQTSIVVSDDTYSGVEYNDTLLYVKNTDGNIYDNENTKEKNANVYLTVTFKK